MTIPVKRTDVGGRYYKSRCIGRTPSKVDLAVVPQQSVPSRQQFATHVVTAATMLYLSMSPLAATLAQTDTAVLDRFRWSTYRTSPVDLLLPNASVFRHRDPALDAQERSAYRELIDEISVRRSELESEMMKGATAAWEEAFYRFEEVRRTAWDKGALTIRGVQTEAGPPDPFRDPDEPVAAMNAGIESYSVQADIRNHPEQFVGRPIVLRGVMRRLETVTIQSASDRRRRVETAEREGTTVTRGELVAFGSSSDSPVALIDTAGVEFTSSRRQGTGPWPSSLQSLPVLVKGWVVKLWDYKPLIYCTSVREISVQPPMELIQQFTVKNSPLLDQESWLYYETLAALEDYEDLRQSPLVKADRLLTHSEAADRFVDARLTALRTEMAAKAVADGEVLQTKLDNGQLTTEQFETRRKRLDQIWRQRESRYEAIAKDHRKFEAFVDLFINPDKWQGQLVTLRGHVRHVLSYPAKHPQIAGEYLHELWLYTDDSQSNPAVIVTRNLPAEFPTEADVIDHVSVTGCFFKPYVYRGQESRRIAPLILASRVHWTPTDDQIISLADSGQLAAGSTLAERARQRNSKGPGGMALLLVSFGAMLTVMILWGRSQRERRDRRNLLKRMNGPPVFESSLDGDYAPRLSDYTAGYDL